VSDVVAPAWTELRPPLRKPSREAFVEHARLLSKRAGDSERVERLRAAFVAEMTICRRADKQALLAAGLVITDLAAQGWEMRARRGRVEVRPPTVNGDRATEKARVRSQELVKRDAQLRQPSVRRFLDAMEKNRLHQGRFVSIFTVMRDGRELAAGLLEARTHFDNGWADALSQLVDPYLDFVVSRMRSAPTPGSVDGYLALLPPHVEQPAHQCPGRTMHFLVRDRAAKTTRSWVSVR